MMENSSSKKYLSKIRRFYLQRNEDESGVSGTGIVVTGVEFPSGQVAIEWSASPVKSVTIYPNVEAMVGVHSHGGKTVLKWIDEE
ncbi:hypothetical protein MKY96_32705 [Paenibacillus sp. FSL R7-0302]|uniref:hypothetical protein n=1 Tax=Paenibacillus sp. FSL R7-0302 TaxID=2921681 RepID=UPI0030F56CE7